MVLCLPVTTSTGSTAAPAYVRHNEAQAFDITAASAVCCTALSGRYTVQTTGQKMIPETDTNKRCAILFVHPCVAKHR
jgi:hypothetical protein